MAERTEAPTPHRREEARRKGQVAKSVEINSAAILLVGFWMLSSSGLNLYMSMSTVMRQSFAQLGQADFSMATITSGAAAIGSITLQALAPVLLVMMGTGVVINLMQVGFMFSENALKPDLNRINPLSGLKRIFSGRGAMELLKSLLKLIILGYVAYSALQDNTPTLYAMTRMTLPVGLSALAQIGLSIGMRIAEAMLIIAVADYMFQRKEFEKSLRMSRQELIEEMKRYENPQLKARIRSRQRQLAMRRMMAAVPQADVVITNPTHLAVVLKYEQGKMKAPKVVAKGERLVAERIRELARENNVPIVENKPLARALYKMTEIGQEIPAELYQMVAEVLAFVYRLKSTSSFQTATA
jgi:flagellar biosynthesis protein FlhB